MNVVNAPERQNATPSAGFHPLLAVSKELEAAVQIVQQRMCDLTVIGKDPTRPETQGGDPMVRFAREMSSDLSRPLDALSRYLRLSKEKYWDQLDPGMQEFVGCVAGEAARLAVVVAGLSAYADADRPATTAPISSEAVLEKVLADLATRIPREGYKITHDPLPIVRADEDRLAKVFANLIENAVLFHGQTPPCVHISARRMEESPHHPSESCRPGMEGLWRFVVEDNGVGLSESDQTRVFGLFYRVPGWETTPGAGIGLTLCKKIVQRLGGEITVESEVGKGSRFIFTLPAD